MYQFLQASNPALRAQLEAQFSLFRDISQKFFDAADKMNQLNLQVSQNILEESIHSTQQVLAAQSPYDALSAAASRVQPAADHLRSYQHQATTIAADTQAEIAKTAETRVPEATRAAANVAQEVARRASEESERISQRQQEISDKIAGRPGSAKQPQNSQTARPNA